MHQRTVRAEDFEGLPRDTGPRRSSVGASNVGASGVGTRGVRTCGVRTRGGASVGVFVVEGPTARAAAEHGDREE
jgi:hypothetical protein